MSMDRVRTLGFLDDKKKTLLALTLTGPKGFFCPACGAERVAQFRRGRSKIFQFCNCRKQVSLISGMIFHGSNLPLIQWFLAISASMLELRRMLGLSYKAAWRFKHKVMQAMFECEESTVLAQRVEIDDAYLGNTPAARVGRGSENKVPFIRRCKPVITDNLCERFLGW